MTMPFLKRTSKTLSICNNYIYLITPNKYSDIFEHKIIIETTYICTLFKIKLLNFFIKLLNFFIVCCYKIASVIVQTVP